MFSSASQRLPSSSRAGGLSILPADAPTEFQRFVGSIPPRTFAGYHLPKCAPPSTCSTSPVTCGASVK
jgi:hypothetical protein